jgi:hypothetical protein
MTKKHKHEYKTRTQNSINRYLIVVLFSLLISSCFHTSVLGTNNIEETLESELTLSHHYIFGTAQYNDGILAAGAKIEVVSSYGTIVDWVNAAGQWSVDVGDPGPNWPDGTYFTVYAIGCCAHDGWTGRKQGVVSGNENNVGVVLLVQNQPPETPKTPAGPEHLVIGMDGTYRTWSTDPNYKHTIDYRFDWDSEGSHDYSQFSPSLPSRVNVSMTHTWNQPGIYSVTALAKDNYGAQSAWSNGLMVTVYQSNSPPEQPIIDGANDGVKNQEYTMSITGSDPENQDLYYFIDWDDDTYASWIGPYVSNEPVILSHTWDTTGTYTITIKAKDIIGEESQMITHTIEIFGPSVSITSVHADQGSIVADITNTGVVSVEYITWSITVDGKWLFQGEETEGIIYHIDKQDAEIIQSDPVFGIGFKFDVEITAQIEGENPINWTGSAIILLRFILLRN